MGGGGMGGKSADALHSSAQSLGWWRTKERTRSVHATDTAIINGQKNVIHSNWRLTHFLFEC